VRPRGAGAVTFLNWWFEQHWFWSTVLSPGASAVWSIYMEQTGRAVVATVLWICWRVLR
jgi:hypothetical protein